MDFTLWSRKIALKNVPGRRGVAVSISCRHPKTIAKAFVNYLLGPLVISVVIARSAQKPAELAIISLPLPR